MLPLVYEELRKLAASKMANEAAGNTLQPTALVHEAWLRLVGTDNPKFAGRAHFFVAAAEAMRRILIDRARSKRALRHGGGQVRVNIQGLDLASPDADDQLPAVNDALDKLAKQDPIEAELVKLRYFAGLTVEEAASQLGILGARPGTTGRTPAPGSTTKSRSATTNLPAELRSERSRAVFSK
jgi:RNA polymerase sigma factor (TIGR02999 family)